MSGGQTARQVQLIHDFEPDAIMCTPSYLLTIADIAGKRRVSYEMPLLGPDGRTVWQRAEDFDSNGILDRFAIEGQPDAVETIATAYAALGRHREGPVGSARCRLIEAPDIVAFGVAYLEALD